MKSARVVFRVARGVEVRFSQGICRLFGSCPLRRTALLSTFYALLTDGPLVSRPVRRQSRLGTLAFTRKTGDFAAEGVGFELGSRFFNARGLIDSGESAYQPIQKLTDP